MNHASGAVAPPDAEVIQAGDAIRQRAKRRGLVQAWRPKTCEPSDAQQETPVCRSPSDR
jgi:hypothetical protein